MFYGNDLNNTGYFYHGNINVNGNNVSGKITKEDQAGVGYEMTYTGTKSGNNLTVSVTYSNDATSPFIEQWVLDASGLKIANPVILVPVTVCK